MRLTLSGDTTYYLSPTGNDAADGLTPATAWKTRNKAWNYAVANIDCAGYVLKFKMLNGEYNDEFAASGMPVGVGANRPVFEGDPSNWWNVFVNTHDGSFRAYDRATFSVRNVRLRSAVGDCLFASWYSQLYFGNIAFDTAGQAHINASKHAWCFTEGNYDVWGDAQNHVLASNFGNPFLSGVTANFYGNRTFDVVAKAIANGQVGSHTMTFSGGVLGKRYQATHCSMVGGLGGPLYWPGSTPGTVDSTSSYL